MPGRRGPGAGALVREVPGDLSVWSEMTSATPAAFRPVPLILVAVAVVCGALACRMLGLGEGVLLVAAPGHPLAAAPTLTLADLQPHMELTVHDPALGPDQPNPHRLPTSRAFHLSDFNTKRLALLQGLGFGWMPHYLIAEDLAAGRLVPLAWQPGAEFVFTPHLVHPVARPLGLAGRRFLELLVQAG